MTVDPVRAKAIFLEAVGNHSPQEWDAYLKDACGDDAALRRHIMILLEAHEQAGSFLDAPAVAKTVDMPAEAPIAEGPGTVLGPYKLLQRIGEGGMGVVYMAEQQEPVRRQVALKIIKPGMDSHQVIARFEAERQALALMDHQNIARVLDAGTTASGRPYFVMELVHGVPITQFCDDNQLTPRQRLAIFVPVCQAIQHAHQKGIIHRDVKPSNVLVTLYDDKPVPKVIDFGVAKAIEQRLTERTMFTQFGALVGTFEYMSPEQAQMNAFGVDTRSDIYSLGVLLYELLTGTTPLERQRLREAAFGEMVRLIKEEEAPRPSQRLSSSNNLPSIAALRKTEPARLSKLVRGEIDWIVMKCLEKDRARRYDTASGLARDVERYLADEPVEACPPSARYRLSKFTRKYRKTLVTAAAFAIVLIAGLVVSTWMAVRATSAEHEAIRQRLASEEARQEAVAARQEALAASAEAIRQRDAVRVAAYASHIALARRAWEENNLALARETLDTVPTEAAGQDLRGFEWYYLSHLCRPEAETLAAPVGFLGSVAFSPDGQRLAAASLDRTVGIWDCQTRQKLVTLTGLMDEPIASVAFSPDGLRVAAGSSDNQVKVWDSATGRALFELNGDDEEGPDAVHSPDSRRLVVFSPDGQRLATVGRRVTMWDSATGQKLISFKRPGAGGRNAAFSPDGRRLVTGGREAKIWDSITGQELVTFKGQSAVIGVAFSPDGLRVASASEDHTVKVWDSSSGQELLTLKGHAKAVNCVAFSPDGQRLASGCDDHTVKIWDSVTGQEISTLKGHTGWVVGLAFSPDAQRLATVSDDWTVKLWDVGVPHERFVLKGHAARVWSVAFSPTGEMPGGHRLASGSHGQTVKIWDTATGQELFTLKGHADDQRYAAMVSSVAFSPNGQRLVSASDVETNIWDSATGQELATLGGNTACVAFAPDGKRLAAVSGDQTLKILDSTTGQELFALQRDPTGEITGLAFSPEGRRLAVSSGHEVQLLDSATGQELVTLTGYPDVGVGTVAFSPDGKRLAAVVTSQVIVWDIATGEKLCFLKGHSDWITSVAFSPDGKRLASASSGDVKVWDSATGNELIQLSGHGGWVRAVAFSPDGTCLASANDDGSVDLWETNVTPEVHERRAAHQLVADLFRQKGRRADVLEWLRAVPGMNPMRRQQALIFAQTYPEDP